MLLEAKVFPQFSALIDSLSEYAEKQADSRTNVEQGAWIDLYDSQDTRIELLSRVDRVALNEEFKQMGENPEDSLVVASATAELQHDFIAAVARDMFVVRSPRLGRVFRQSTLDRGYSGDKGVFKSVILKFIETLVGLSQPNNGGNEDIAGEIGSQWIE